MEKIFIYIASLQYSIQKLSLFLIKFSRFMPKKKLLSASIINYLEVQSHSFLKMSCAVHVVNIVQILPLSLSKTTCQNITHQ
jgi:hypothetical protein